MSLTHLNVYSSYSLMNSTVSIDRLMKRASELGFSSIALTDEEVLYGIIPFYKACQSYNIKPIIGMTVQFTLNDSFIDVVLLAKNNEGYSNLLNISTMIQTTEDGFTLEHLTQLGTGLIVIIKTSTGLIEQYLTNEQVSDLTDIYNKFAAIVKREDLYLSVESYNVHLQQLLHNNLKQVVAQHEYINVVAVNEVRYLNEKDVFSYDCLQAMDRGDVWELNKPNRSIENRYLCSKEELAEKFSFWPDALQATIDIASKCHVTIEMDTPRLPSFPLEEGDTAHSVLTHTCFTNVNRLYENVTDDIKQRLTYELNIIESLGFSDYFLIVADFVAFAKKQHISVGPGRGSAAGSLVSYVLGITSVDPIKHNLLFERFLNPERTSLPDIDIDFSDVRRDEVINYVKEKYGHDHVAQIITFGTFGARSLLRELMKTLDVDERDQTYLLKHIPVQSSKSIITHVSESEQLKTYVKKSKKLRLLFHIAQNLEGLPRHISTHAAGIVITKEKLVNYVPLTYGQDDFYLTQFSMNELASIGLLKIDLLGLKNLSLIERIVKGVQRIEQKQIDLTRIPANDPKTFQLLQEGRTNGIFQLESAGMKRVLKQLKPTSFEDIVALNALYRPGPMEQIPTYIARKHGQETFTYLHPDLEPILQDTYGVLIYQEQIMQIAHKLAGFSLGEADLLRRAMSKKERQLMDEQKESFINGCLKNGYSEQVAHQLFSWIEKFANYGFNKSHSVAYSKIAYQLSYLKAHFPHLFLAQLLSTVTNDSSKLAQYVKDANDLNITILQPSINNSFGQFSVEGDNIRIGLLAIKGIGYQTVQEIVRVRREKRFTDLFDFCLRVSQHVVKRNTIETLILSGAFDELNENRASLLASIDEALERAELFGSKDGQVNLFTNKLEMREPDYVKIDDFTQMKKLSDEKELIGIYVSDHPLTENRLLLTFNNYVTIEHVLLTKSKKHVKLVGIIQRINKIRTKRGESMAFLTISDETGEIEVVVFPDSYRKAGQWIEEDIVISGDFTVSERDGNKQLIANYLEQFNKNDLKEISTTQLFIRFTKEMDNEKVKTLQKLVQKYPGNTMIIVYYEKEKQTYRLGSQYLINPSNEAMTTLKSIFGDSNVVLRKIRSE